MDSDVAPERGLSSSRALWSDEGEGEVGRRRSSQDAARCRGPGCARRPSGPQTSAGQGCSFMMASRILVKCAEHRLHLRDPPCVRRSRSRQAFIKQLFFVFPSKKRSHFQKYVCLSFRDKPSRDETGIYLSSSVRGWSRDDSERGVSFCRAPLLSPSDFLRFRYRRLGTVMSRLSVATRCP